MNTIAASALTELLSPEATAWALRDSSGEPYREVGREELNVLIAADHVVGVVRRGKLREIRLTCATDVAFGDVSEACERQHSQANQTTFEETVVDGRAKLVQHHRAHCRAWNGTAKREAAVCMDYLDLSLSTHEIEAKYKLHWSGPDSLVAIIERHGLPLRADHHGRKPVRKPAAKDDNAREVIHSVEHGMERLRVFKPFTDEERIALYRRVWGPDWNPATIGLADKAAHSTEETLSTMREP